MVGGSASFQDYLSKIGIGAKRTAQYISVNSYSELSKELQDAGCMVFRLGAPSGSKHTHFALASTVTGWSDYFLMDRELFSSSEPEVFLPNVSVRSLFAFQLLPKLTETSLVNLSLASGVLPHALNCGDKGHQLIPATGQSVFTFEFRPHSSSAISLLHSSGQVEIDAIFVGQRGGKECLFIIEAKSGRFDSISKHKLVYPLLAIKEKVPAYMEIIPVYVRAIRRDGCIEFNIAECSLKVEDGQIPAMDQLVVNKVSRYSLWGY